VVVQKGGHERQADHVRLGSGRHRVRKARFGPRQEGIGVPPVRPAVDAEADLAGLPGGLELRGELVVEAASSEQVGIAAFGQR
jgi:hypothetical protein